MSDLLKRLRAAGDDYTVAWGSGELYDEAADELERLTRELEEARKDQARWQKARILARYSPNIEGGDSLAFDRLPWPMSCHATTPEYADAAIDAAMSQEK